MSTNYGIKVVQSGADIDTTDIREILMSSDYPMLKYHTDSNAQVTISSGETDAYTDVNHNLGYVPAFIAYHVESGNSYYIPTLGRGSTPPWYTYAWADTSKIRIGIAYNSPYGQLEYQPTNTGDYWHEQLNANGLITIGTRGGGDRNGAVRVDGVELTSSSSISTAIIDYAVEIKGAGAGNILTKTWGIDEDDVSLFSSSPMGASETSAVTTQSNVLPSTGQYFGIDVKSQIEEIIARSGWASGNAMGFKIRNNSSPADVWAEDDGGSGVDFKLKITLSGARTLDFRVIVFKDKISA